MRFRCLILIMFALTAIDIDKEPKYKFIRKLGQGAFGQVDLARNRFGQIRAIKRMHKRHKSTFINEYEVGYFMESPFLNKPHEAFQLKNHLYLVMDYISDISLANLIDRFAPFNLKIVKFIGRQIFLGVKHLHEFGIGHFDLTPSNLMIDSFGNAIIIDFGMATRNYKYNIEGTAEYMSIDIFMNDYYTKEVDYWSFGVILYELLTKKVPFKGKVYGTTVSSIFKFKNQVDYKLIRDEETVDFIKHLLMIDINQRLSTLNDIENHKWFFGTDWVLYLTKSIPSPIIKFIINLETKGKRLIEI